MTSARTIKAAAPPAKAGSGDAPRRRLSRVERTPEAREKIFEAAAKVVGEFGYTAASTKRIAAAAGIAEGTLYLYFSSRQALFDELLPHVGDRMLRFIGQRLRGARNIYELEEWGLRAYFDFLAETPGFHRVFSEAETAAPEAHREHHRMIAEGYQRALRRAIERGEVQHFAPDEIETLAYIFMAARAYLAMRYLRMDHPAATMPDEVIATYMKLVRGGVR